jgi:spermidine synthase
MVGVAYALSGFIAMSYEIIWTRTFQIQVGTSIYAFSIMLAFYLAGIGAGSLTGGRLFAGTRFPLRAFGFAQLGIALYGMLGLRFGTLFPPVTLSIHLGLNNAVFMPLLIVFPVTFVLGAMFPAVCRSYVPGEAEVSRSVGRLYSLNTLGCILGSLACGFLFIGVLGTRGTMMVLAALNALLGVVIVLREPGAPRPGLARAAAGGLVALTALACVLAPDPFMVAVRRAIGNTLGESAYRARIYLHKESVAATTTALGTDDDRTSKHLWVNGIGMTNLCVETKLMAHIPLLLHPDPKEALVVCFGMGTTVRSVRAHPGVACDVVELVPEVYECFRYFHADGPEVMADPRVRCYADDGRNFLLMRPKTYDVITIDPAPPIWSAGTVNLYSREFFELCKARLNAQGILCLWLPPVEASEMRMVLKTYHAVFPHTFVWRSTWKPESGLFLLGFRDPPAQLDLVARGAAGMRIAGDLNEWGDNLNPRTFLAELFQGRPDDVAAYAGDAKIITDDRPYTEFPLWRSIRDPLYKERLAVREGMGRGFIPAGGGF